MKGICPTPGKNCDTCEMYNEEEDVCMQDEDLGCTGHGDISYSDADPGL